MIYSGKNIRVHLTDEGFVELCLDRQDGAVNQLDRQTLTELRFALEAVAGEPRVAGVLVTSAKEGFMVGADLSEFRMLFSLPRAALAAELRGMNEALVALEDLDVPTVAVVNGYALGGGLELALATSLRVFSVDAKVGLPEVTLGLIPAFGGMVRLPRLTGLPLALQWVLSAKQVDAETARKAGLADDICSPADLRESALNLLRRASAGKLRWRTLQESKRQPLPAADMTAVKALRQSVEAPVQSAAAVGGEQEAMRAAVEVIEQSHTLHREEALAVEADVFAQLANNQASTALVQTFLNRRALRRRMRTLAQSSPRLMSVYAAAQPRALGLAVASAARGMSACAWGKSWPTDPAVVASVAADAGLDEASATVALQNLSQRGPAESGVSLASVLLDEGPSDPLEREERLLRAEASTSSDGVVLCLFAPWLPNAELGALAHPERLVGFNLFGPLEHTELVELLQTTHAQKDAVAMAVRYVRALGKSAIIVAPGHASVIGAVVASLLAAMAPFAAQLGGLDVLDATLKDQGWTRSLSEMSRIAQSQPQWISQFPGHGSAAPDALLAGQDLSHRLALRLGLECCRLLGAGAMAVPGDLDVAALLTVGFPPHLGGPLQYLDWLGAARSITDAEAFGYPVPESLRRMAMDGQTFFRP